MGEIASHLVTSLLFCSSSPPIPLSLLFRPPTPSSIVEGEGLVRCAQRLTGSLIEEGREEGVLRLVAAARAFFAEKNPPLLSLFLLGMCRAFMLACAKQSSSAVKKQRTAAEKAFASSFFFPVSGGGSREVKALSHEITRCEESPAFITAVLRLLLEASAAPRTTIGREGRSVGTVVLREVLFLIFSGPTNHLVSESKERIVILLAEALIASAEGDSSEGDSSVCEQRSIERFCSSMLLQHQRSQPPESPAFVAQSKTDKGDTERIRENSIAVATGILQSWSDVVEEVFFDESRLNAQKDESGNGGRAGLERADRRPQTAAKMGEGSWCVRALSMFLDALMEATAFSPPSGRSARMATIKASATLFSILEKTQDESGVGEEEETIVCKSARHTCNYLREKWERWLMGIIEAVDYRGHTPDEVELLSGLLLLRFLPPKRPNEGGAHLQKGASESSGEWPLAARLLQCFGFAGLAKQTYQTASEVLSLQNVSLILEGVDRLIAEKGVSYPGLAPATWKGILFSLCLWTGRRGDRPPTVAAGCDEEEESLFCVVHRLFQWLAQREGRSGLQSLAVAEGELISIGKGLGELCIQALTQGITVAGSLFGLLLRGPRLAEEESAVTSAVLWAASEHFAMSLQRCFADTATAEERVQPVKAELTSWIHEEKVRCTSSEGANRALVVVASLAFAFNSSEVTQFPLTMRFFCFVFDELSGARRQELAAVGARRRGQPTSCTPGRGTARDHRSPQRHGEK